MTQGYVDTAGDKYNFKLKLAPENSIVAAVTWARGGLYLGD